MSIDLLLPEERDFWCQDSEGEICETIIGATEFGCIGGGCVLVDKGGYLTQYIVPSSFDEDIVGKTATLSLRALMYLTEPLDGFTSDNLTIGLGDELVREAISLDWQQFNRNFILPEPRDGRIGVYLRSNNEPSHPNYPRYSIYLDEIRLMVEGTTSSNSTPNSPSSASSPENSGDSPNIGFEGENTGDDGGSNKAAIVGGVVGGIVFLVLVSGLIWLFLIRRKRRVVEVEKSLSSPFRPQAPHGGLTTKSLTSTPGVEQNMTEILPSVAVPALGRYNRQPESSTPPARPSTETESTANDFNRPRSFHKPRANFATFNQGATTSHTHSTARAEPSAPPSITATPVNNIHNVPEHAPNSSISPANALPSYAMAITNSDNRNSAAQSGQATIGSHPFSTTSSLPTSQNPPYNDALSMWAEANRHWINAALESKLRAASYHPDDDPDTLDAETWKNDYGVTLFELRRLQELYARI